MKKECIKCKKGLDGNCFTEFIAVTKAGKIKKRRSVCYDCNYRKRIVTAFRWKNSTKKEKLENLKKRFNEYVIKKTGCWGWNGFIRSDGYTRMRLGTGVQSRSVGAHVISWMIHNNDINVNGYKKNGFYILHKCDTRYCSNPKHLFKGNHADNMIDMAKKGRVKNSKLTVKDVKNIKKFLKNNIRITPLSKKYNVSFSTIYDIKNENSWKHVTI